MDPGVVGHPSVLRSVASHAWQVVFSGLLIKFNERNKRQERVIVVTNQVGSAVRGYARELSRTRCAVRARPGRVQLRQEPLQESKNANPL